MASSVFFKFKSQKEPQRVTFDGTGITVFELKREIINLSRLGDGTDFDLSIYNEDTNEEYIDDTEVIPRSSSVTARRLPASKHGQGKAARYVSGRMPANARAPHRLEKPSTTTNNNKGSAPSLDKAQTEEERIAAMHQIGASEWELQKEQMAGATPVYRPGAKSKQVAVPDHKPPPGYICYRCHEKGHWIQACPTNNDPNFDGRPRVKRTTGIPRSFLQTVEKPGATSNDGLTDESRQPTGVMVNAEGEYVVAVPDKASWEQYQAKAAQASAAQEDVAVAGNKELAERGLECPIDKRLFVNPMKTPCCGKTFCSDCIENALLNSDLVCPACSTDGVLIDNLVTDDEANKKIAAYEEEKKAAKEAKENKRATPPSEQPLKDDSTAATNENKQGTPKPATPAAEQAVEDGKSPRASASPAPDGSLKKRPAEGTPEGERSSKQPRSPPTAPAAMQTASEPPKDANQPPTGPQGMQQQPNKPLDQSSFIEQMNALAGTNGAFPNMPFPAPNGMPGFPNMMVPGGAGGPNMMMGMNQMQQMQMMMQNPMMMQQMMQQGPPPMPPYMMNGGPGVGGNFNGMNQNQQWNNTGMPNFPIPPSGPANSAHGQNNWNPGYGVGGNFANARGGGNNRGRGGFQQYGNHIQAQSNANTNPDDNNDEDDGAYMRKPVNPHRHQGRQRKVRPMDYREL